MAGELLVQIKGHWGVSRKLLPWEAAGSAVVTSSAQATTVKTATEALETRMVSCELAAPISAGVRCTKQDTILCRGGGVNEARKVKQVLLYERQGLRVCFQVTMWR